MSARSRLHSRRRHDSFDFEHAGMAYRVGLGFYGDGRLGEIFLDCVKGDSMLDVRARDDAVLLSLLLQHNCSIDAIRHAMMRRGDGAALGLIGALLDCLAGGFGALPPLSGEGAAS
jgi:hypothetical protein